jgi:hypothetical protein
LGHDAEHRNSQFHFSLRAITGSLPVYDVALNDPEGRLARIAHRWFPSQVMDVVRLHWPEEADRRAVLQRRGVPRLLLVGPGETPPDTIDVLEDWARDGAAEGDVAARVLTLALRAARLPRPPYFDDDGLLRYGRQLVLLSPLETRVAEVLVGRLGHVVDGETVARAGWPGEAPTDTTMTAAMRRLRDRLRPAGLILTLIASKGWMLEARPTA